jgi:hypothetical protein
MKTRNNVRQYYSATFCGTRCGHHHRDFASAERCAKKTMNAAKRGHRFDNSDLIAEWARAGDDPASFVHSHLISL